MWKRNLFIKRKPKRPRVGSIPAWHDLLSNTSQCHTSARDRNVLNMPSPSSQHKCLKHSYQFADDWKESIAGRLWWHSQIFLRLITIVCMSCAIWWRIVSLKYLSVSAFVLCAWSEIWNERNKRNEAMSAYYAMQHEIKHSNPNNDPDLRLSWIYAAVVNLCANQSPCCRWTLHQHMVDGKQEYLVPEDTC